MAAFGARPARSILGWFASPWLPVHLALLSVALCLPALGVGWQSDDYFQRMIMLGKAAHEVAPMQAFAVLSGEETRLPEYIDWGVFPWWTADNLRLGFFRYLTVATVWLDYQLWPDSAPLMHAHSLAWLGLLVAAAAVLYRRLMSTSLLAGLAGLLYALDESQAGAAAWLANRNALLATGLGLLCLVAHDRWRRDAWRPGVWVAPTLLGLALASGEMALATAGYLVAYGLFLDPGRRSVAVGALRWPAAVLVVWAGVYRWFGFGVRGSGLYLDPVGDAGAYLAMLPERLPLLLLGQWTPVAADAGWILPEPAARSAWMAGLGVAAVLALALTPLLRRDRVARFWALGSVLSLLPVAATFPSNRLLFFVGVGAMGLAAQLLVAVFSGEPAASGRLWRLAARSVGVALILFHLVVAPLAKPLGTLLVRQLGEPTRRALDSLPADPSVAQKQLVVANTPDYLTLVGMIPVIRAVEDKPYPGRIRTLSAGPVATVLTRIDTRTVRVRVEGGLFAGPLAELFRSRHDPLPAGTVVELTGVRVTVAADRGGIPVEIEYQFDRPLEDPSLYWVRWRDGVYEPLRPPPIGETLRLPPARGPFEEMAERLGV